jgi:hypothetical protein
MKSLTDVHRTEFAHALQEWQYTPVEDLHLDDFYHRAESQTRHLESGRSQALELLLTLRKVLLDLEQKLEIQVTWTPESEEWRETEAYLNMRTYQRVLNMLEGHVVACLFELTKANQSGTGESNASHQTQI